MLVTKGDMQAVGCFSCEGGYAFKWAMLVAKGDMHGSGMY